MFEIVTTLTVVFLLALLSVIIYFIGNIVFQIMDYYIDKALFQEELNAKHRRIRLEFKQKMQEMHQAQDIHKMQEISLK